MGFHDCSFSYLQAMHQLGLDPKPKDHMLCHLASRSLQQGSPALYANWYDESINKMLRDIASGAHSMVFERRVLSEFPMAWAKRRRLK